MAEKEVVSVEVKTETKKAQKDISSLAGEIEFMGVSVSSVSAGFKTMAATAKASFRTITAAIASTGIGVFLIAIGSLVAYFKSSEKAATGLQKIMGTLNAIWGNAVDILEDLGKGIASLSWEGFTQGVKNAINGVKNFTKNTKEDIKTTVDAIDAQYELNQAIRQNTITRARNEKRISELRLKARDEEKFNHEERLEFIQEANKLSEEQLERDLRIAKEKLRINKEENRVKGELNKEELDQEAELAANILRIENRNFLALKRLKQEEIALINQVKQANKASLDDLIASADAWEEKTLAAQDAVAAVKEKALQDREKAVFTFLDAEAQQIETNYKKEIRFAEAQGKDTAAIDAKFAKKREEQAKKMKAFRVAEAIMSTYQAANEAFKNAQNIGGGVGLALAPIAAASAIAAGLANVRMILAQDVGGGTGGGAPVAASQEPAPQMMSGAFQLTGGVQPEAMKAFVVTDEMTNSQNQLANIRRRATI